MKTYMFIDNKTQYITYDIMLCWDLLV